MAKWTPGMYQIVVHSFILLCLSRCGAAVCKTFGGGGEGRCRGLQGGLVSKITPKHN